LGTVEVLEAVRVEMERQKRLVRLIFSGSSAVYGKNGEKNVPISESRVSAQPLSLYTAQKLGSEHVIRNYVENRGVEAVVFRYFNVYGPFQDPSSPYSGVISIFAKRVLEGKSFDLHGGGTQTRDFVSVHDVARTRRCPGVRP
jgi:UDP-glucose 4-epimerase